MPAYLAKTRRKANLKDTEKGRKRGAPPGARIAAADIAAQAGTGLKCRQPNFPGDVRGRSRMLTGKKRGKSWFLNLGQEFQCPCLPGVIGRFVIAVLSRVGLEAVPSWAVSDRRVEAPDVCVVAVPAGDFLQHGVGMRRHFIAIRFDILW